MTRTTTPAFPRSAAVLAYAVAALAALAAGVALLDPDIYARDPAVLRPQMLGQDLVTLVVAAPLLALAARRASGGSLAAYVAASALTFYMAYTYATYAFGTRFNALFPVYVAILGASTYALFVLARHLPVHAVGARTWAATPRRALVGVLLAIVLVFTLLWGADIVPAMLEGGPPAAAVESATPTSPVHVVDLAFLLPLGVVAAVLLLRRDPMGVLLAGIFLVKGVTVALAVLSMAAFSARAGLAVNVPVAAGIVAALVAMLLVGGPYARALLATSTPHGAARGDAR